MKPYQVFSRMTPERAAEVFGRLSEETPAVYTQAVAAASRVMKARPRFLMKQPKERRANLLRQALSRVAANELAEEVLAAYFLQSRKPLLLEWLDAVGVEHDEGVLREDAPPAPPREQLEAAVAQFREGDQAADRELLLQSFSSQSAVDWPDLRALLEE